ncbi:MAG: hypothetical protein IPJ01_12370 [Micavibrio sp.]|nr:hypothetical protein [Micavibrio sp.]
MEKDIIIKKKKMYEDFWSNLLKVQFNELTIKQLYVIIANDITTGDSQKYFLNNIKRVQANEITIKEFQDIISNDINKMGFQLRDIEDTENNIVRKPFHPEKLIGKTISLKAYDVTDKKDYRYFKIISIKSHFPVKENLLDEDMVSYNAYEDNELTTLPLYQYRIQEIIDKGISITKDTYRYGEKEESNECIYKIVE